jgi:hypothetical protein
MTTLEVEENERLLDEVMVALGDMVDMTCAAMRPLWLRASLRVRKELVRRPFDAPECPASLANYGRSSRSKYTALAGWRHSVVWLALLEQQDTFGEREALEALRVVYFQQYPKNSPPFSYAQRTSDAPGRPRGQSVENLRAWAVEGCAATIRSLLEERLRFHQQRDGGRLDFVQLGLPIRLRDFLKLEGMEIEGWTADVEVEA